ncbi:hypothetical protein SGLAM104S_05397 [Streptomyces glaucescens]
MPSTHLVSAGWQAFVAHAGGADVDVGVAEERGDPLDRVVQLLEDVVAEPVDVGVLDRAELGEGGAVAVAGFLRQDGRVADRDHLGVGCGLVHLGQHLDVLVLDSGELVLDALLPLGWTGAVLAGQRSAPGAAGGVRVAGEAGGCLFGLGCEVVGEGGLVGLGSGVGGGECRHARRFQEAAGPRALAHAARGVDPMSIFSANVRRAHDKWRQAHAEALKYPPLQQAGHRAPQAGRRRMSVWLWAESTRALAHAARHPRARGWPSTTIVVEGHPLGSGHRTAVARPRVRPGRSCRTGSSGGHPTHPRRSRGRDGPRRRPSGRSPDPPAPGSRGTRRPW